MSSGYTWYVFVVWSEFSLRLNTSLAAWRDALIASIAAAPHIAASASLDALHDAFHATMKWCLSLASALDDLVLSLVQFSTALQMVLYILILPIITLYNELYHVPKHPYERILSVVLTHELVHHAMMARGRGARLQVRLLLRQRARQRRSADQGARQAAMWYGTYVALLWGMQRAMLWGLEWVSEGEFGPWLFYEILLGVGSWLFRRGLLREGNQEIVENWVKRALRYLGRWQPIGAGLERLGVL